MDEINNNTVIKNISTDQSEILKNIIYLYNNNEPFECDITASELKFYQKRNKNKYDIPIPKILMDVYPTNDNIIKITPFQKLPLEDKSISSIVVDLPFVISPKTCASKTNPKEGSNIISKRFSSFYPADELFENIYWWIKESYRVLKDNGICVWKMQSTISAGREVWSVPFSFLCADKLGFYCIDEFILEAKTRLVANSHFKNGQLHARKYTSTFYVFKKDEKLAKNNSCFKWLKQCEEQDLEGKVWIEPKELKRQMQRQMNEEETAKSKISIPKEYKRNRKSYKIEKYDQNGNLLETFISLNEVFKQTGISKSSISQCVNGRIKTSGGFIWKKVEE